MHLIYQRYLLKSFITRFLIILTLFVMFYLLLDFALNIRANWNGKSAFFEMLKYYLLEILLKLELLIPLCFILAMIQTIYYLNYGQELIAFQACGIPRQLLLKPIATFAWILTLFLFLNTQILIPKSKALATEFKKTAKKKRPKKDPHVLFHRYLNEDSILIYGSYQVSTERFEDVFWIKTPQLFWHFESLDFQDGKMVGYEAQLFQRDESHGIQLIEEHNKKILFEMPILQHEEKKEPLSFEFLSFTQLLMKQIQDFEKHTLHYNQLQSRFWHKMALPFFTPLLFYLFALPCTRYNRYRKTTGMIALALIFFVGFFTLLNALSILSEHHILSPIVASFGPFMLFGIPSLFFYHKASNG